MEPCNSEGVGYMFNSSKTLGTCKGRTAAHMCRLFSGLRRGLFLVKCTTFKTGRSTSGVVEHPQFCSTPYSLLQIITESSSKHSVTGNFTAQQMTDRLVISRRRCCVREDFFNNGVTFVFRSDDEEEAHFLTRWEITPCHVSQPSTTLWMSPWGEKKRRGGGRIQQSKSTLVSGTCRDCSCVTV